ncbi:MAG TPA: hypothetical protein VKR06_03290 [Ktedonosporobacter sp.]|nr:hypothetical protein [Ktedonosporobacter sp.]
MQVTKQLAEWLLVTAIRRGEKKLIRSFQEHNALLNDPRLVLTGLAAFSIMELHGGKEGRTSVDGLLRMSEFIATSDEYIPSSDFPFTKEQLCQSWEASENGTHPDPLEIPTPMALDDPVLEDLLDSIADDSEEEFLIRKRDVPQSQRLSEAVRLAEKELMKIWLQKAIGPANSLQALAALIARTTFVLERNLGDMSHWDEEDLDLISDLPEFIATSDGYIPSPDFPFTKEQLRQVWEDEGSSLL